MAFDLNDRPILDGKWRPQPFPLDDARWCLVKYDRYRSNGRDYYSRTVWQEHRRGRRWPMAFDSELQAQRHADKLNSPMMVKP